MEKRDLRQVPKVSWDQEQVHREEAQNHGEETLAHALTAVQFGGTAW